MLRINVVAGKMSTATVKTESPVYSIQDYYSTLTNQFITMGRFRPCPGHATFAIWKDEAHLKAWNGVWSSVKDEDFIRFLTVPLEMLSMIKLPPNVAPRQITVLGIGYSTRADLTDLEVHYRRFSV